MFQALNKTLWYKIESPISPSGAPHTWDIHLHKAFLPHHAVGGDVDCTS